MRFPARADALTVEWFTKVLRETGAIKRASVSELQVEPLDKTKSRFGSLARVVLHYSADDGGPASLIAKFSHADPQMLGWLKQFYEREIRFYETVARDVALHTPRYYYGAFDPESGEHVVLLEDVVAASSGDLASGCSVDEAKAAAVEVARLHAPYWDSHRLESWNWLWRLSGDQFGRNQESYQNTWEPFLDKVGPGLPRELIDTGERLRERVIELYSHFYREPPQTLIHHDYHIDNILFRAGGQAGLGKTVIVLDWQTAAQGRGIADVRNFLCHSLAPEDRRACEMDILASYHAALVERGIHGYSLDECVRDYRYGMLLSLFVIVGYIGAGTFKDETTRHLVNDIVLPRIVAAIVDLDVGDLLE